MWISIEEKARVAELFAVGVPSWKIREELGLSATCRASPGSPAADTVEAAACAVDIAVVVGRTRGDLAWSGIG